MKKRFFCIVLACMMLFSLTSAHAVINNFFLRTRYGQLVPYENLVFHYAIHVYSGFMMSSDEQLNARWDSMTFEEGEDMLYDFRYWLSPDRTYEFQVQVKEQTYDSFETEVQKAPDYISLMEEDMLALGYYNIRQLHEGILRDTPEGKMLETAYAFTVPVEGGGVDITVVYYDCYFEGVEYIFEMTAYNGDYETAQYLLNEMVQTVDIWSPAYAI